MKLVMIEDMYEIVITLLIRSDSFSFIYEHFTNGYHVYLKVWIPLLDECLFGNKEQSNGVDKNAVAVIRLNNCGKEEVVSYVPQSISKVVSLYLSLCHIVTWNLKSLENVWTVVVVMDIKLRQGFVFMGLRASRRGCKLD